MLVTALLIDGIFTTIGLVGYLACHSIYPGRGIKTEDGTVPFENIFLGISLGSIFLLVLFSFILEMPFLVRCILFVVGLSPVIFAVWSFKEKPISTTTESTT